MACSTLEGEGVREAETARCGRSLPTYLDVSHPRGRAEGMAWRVALAVCAVAVCSAQCPPHSVPAPSHNTTSCVCTAGYGGPSGGPCSPCASGTYKRAAGSGACTACPPGSFTSHSNASTFCSVCPPGTYLAGAPDAVTCRACPPRGSNSSAPNTWSNCTDNTIFLSPQDDWKGRIEEAPNGSTVLLFPGVYAGECNVRVQRNIALRGVSGKAETDLDCQQRNRHLHVTGASVTIEGLTLTNGHAGSGGGGCVLADGTASVAISGSLLAACSTLSHGGLLRLGQNSVLLLSDQTELRNGSARGHGGGVFLEEGSLMTASRNVMIVGNTAAERGGGIFSGSSSMVDLREGVEIRGCVAGSAGGGVLLEGDSTLRAVGNVSIVGNTAAFGGGGLHVIASTVDLEEGVEIRDCVAGLLGGGVYLQVYSTLRAAGNVSIVGNEALARGGGVYAVGTCVVDLGEGVEISGCVAGVVGGGVALHEDSTLRAVGNVSIVGNEAWASGGGIYGAFSSVVDLGEGVEISGCVAGDSGGGVYLMDGSTLRAVNVSIVDNEAGADGGGIFGGRSSVVDLRQGVEIRRCVAGRDGGGLLVLGGAALTAHDSWFDECNAGGLGGALVLKDRATASLAGSMLISRSRARDGGGIFSQGLELEFAGETLTVRGNSASGRGGGIASWTPLHLRSGSTTLASNQAHVGGGWCGIGYEAVLAIGADANLMVENCSAASDGGGMALMDLAAVEFEPEPEPCPSHCSLIQSCDNRGACLIPQCNFNGGACKTRFEEAGLDAAQACDREKCPIWRERYDTGEGGTCGNNGECLVASCDWAEDSPPCRQVLDGLRACPLFDAVAYDSIMRQGADVMYVQQGGTANGFGRCANASCHVAQNGSDSYEWCETIDDGGRVLEQVCKGCGEYVDRGQSWGVCSPGRPRLPSAGFDYDSNTLLALLHAQVEDVMQQHPGCGRNPLRLVSNRAGGKGGGLYNSECHSSRESKGACFIGDIAVGFESALMVLFQGNSAAAGGGLFSACHEVGVCAGLMDKALGLPSQNTTSSSILEFRDNRAVHGDRAASGANKLVVAETAQTQLVPGQDALNVTLLLLDSLHQRVDGRIDPYIIEMLVCATPAGCSSLLSLQPVLFLAYDETQIHTAERYALLQYCTSESSSVVVKFTAVTADGNVEATLEVECLPCRHGQTRTGRAASPGRGGQLWSCERCARGEYVIDPNQHSCQECPEGASCEGGALAGLVEGSVWAANLEGGAYPPGVWLLTACPAGYARESTLSGGVALAKQQCRQCTPGMQYIIDPNAHTCQNCPRGLVCDGTDEVKPVVEGSTWVKAGSYFNLTSCPTGYAVVNADENGFKAEEQRCEECQAGTECAAVQCVTCAACQPGHYKPASSTAPCEACPADSYREEGGGRELAACRLCPFLSSTRRRTGQVSIAACQCGPGFYSYRRGAGLRCLVCPVGATCPDGVSLMTRGDLDATGEVVWGPWEDDTQPGRMWLKQCPQGYRLENQTGYERQECQRVPPGMFIASSADPSFQFQRCPANMFCLNGGPPVPVPVPALLTLRGLPPAAAAWAPAHSEAVRQSVRTGDAQLQVELEEACFAGGACQPLSPSATVAPSVAPSRPVWTRQRRAQPPAGPGEVTVSLQAGAAGRSSEEVKGRLESSAFRAGFEASMAARGIPDVQCTLTTQPLPPTPEGVGTYALVGAAVVLTDCPLGFLIVNASLDEQECFKCPRGAYSLDPIDGCLDGTCRPRDCNSCPVAAVCAGGSHFDSKAQNTTWEVVRDSGAYSKQRLVGCPAGSILVRVESPALAHNDECVACPFGKYSLLPPAYPDVLAVGAAPLASERCLLCRKGLECEGGNRINARHDYWLLSNERSAGPESEGEQGAAGESWLRERRAEAEAPQQGAEAVLIPCPPKACRDGGLCAEGHLGPVCGICRPGWVMSGYRCRDCGSGRNVMTQRLLMGCLAGLLFLAVFTRVVLQPAIYGSSVELEDGHCLSSCLASVVGVRIVAWLKGHIRDLKDHLKVVVSFFQVISTYRTATSSQWGKTSDLFGHAAVLRLDLFNLPWVPCLSLGSSYQDLLLLYTVTPIVICLLLVAPLTVLRLADSPNLSYCVNESCKAVGVFLFLVYPTVSIVSISAFNCQRISDDVRLLVADYREPCPNDDPAGFVFSFSVVCVLVFPLGIILAAFGAMRLFRVPQLAQRKVVEMHIHAMILLYIKQCAAARHEQEDLQRRRQRVVGVAHSESASTDQSESGGLRDGKATAAAAPLDSFRFRHGPRQEAAELPGDCPFEGHETEAKLSEEQIVTLLTHDWRQAPSDEAEAGGGEAWAATVIVPGLEAWSVSQLRTCARAQLLALLRVAAQRLRAGGVLAVPAVAWDPESAEEAERQAGHRVGFLLLTYRPEYWYWELVELARKFFTACATVFVWQRSVRQLSLVLGVTVIALLATMRLEPYRSRSVLNTQIFSLFVQCVTLMYGLTSHCIEATEDRSAAEEGQTAYAVLLFLFAMVPASPLLLAMVQRIRDEWVRRTLTRSPDAQTSPPASRESHTQSEAQIPSLPAVSSDRPASPPPSELMGYTWLLGGSRVTPGGSTLFSLRAASREGVSRTLTAGPEPVEPDALGSVTPLLSPLQPAHPRLCAASTSESPARQPVSTSARSEPPSASDSASPVAVPNESGADADLQVCGMSEAADSDADDAEAALERSGLGAPAADQVGGELFALEVCEAGEAEQAQADAAGTDAWMEVEHEFVA